MSWRLSPATRGKLLSAHTHILTHSTFLCLELQDVGEGGAEVLVEGPVDDVGDVRPERLAGAGVDVVLRHVPEGHVTRLQDIDHSPHVSLAQGHQRLLPVLRDVDGLLLTDVLQPGQDLLLLEGTEPEPGAPALEGGDDLAEVVTDQTEPGNNSNKMASQSNTNRTLSENFSMILLRAFWASLVIASASSRMISL